MKPEKMLERMAAASLMVAAGEPWGDASEDVRQTELSAIQAALRELVIDRVEGEEFTLADEAILMEAVLAITELKL